MKKIIFLVFFLVLIISAITSLLLFGSSTGFKEASKTLYIRSTEATKKAVLDSIEKNGITRYMVSFRFLADRLNYWENIKPGKYLSLIHI